MRSLGLNGFGISIAMKGIGLGNIFFGGPFEADGIKGSDRLVLGLGELRAIDRFVNL